METPTASFAVSDGRQEGIEEKSLVTKIREACTMAIAETNLLELRKSTGGLSAAHTLLVNNVERR